MWEDGRRAGARAPALRPARSRLADWLSVLSAAFVALLLVGLATAHTLRGDVAADLAADRGEGPVVAVPALSERALADQVAPPVEVDIPDLGVRSRLVGLRKDRGGGLQVPQDPQRAGWYNQGFRPGESGPAVIAGHVDSYVGPGVFARLKDMQPGQIINVRRADGTVAVFAVQEVRSYPKSEFPTEQVYVGDGTPSLRLITCGGDFNEDARSYLDNVVVFATPYMEPPAGPAAPAGTFP